MRNVRPGRPRILKKRGPMNSGVYGSPAQTAFEDSLLERIQSVVGDVTCRELAEQTGVHPETVRRYVTVGPPSIFFIAALCRVYKVYPSWLLGFAEPRPARTRPGRKRGTAVARGRVR